MAGRHTITIELDDDEYRWLEEEADYLDVDVQTAARWRLLPPKFEGPDGVRWRSDLIPQYIREARAERDAHLEAVLWGTGQFARARESDE